MAQRIKRTDRTHAKLVARKRKARSARPVSRDYQGTRRTILEHARQLYGEGGYGAVTMRTIAHEMGFSARAIYHYFASKDDLFMALKEEGGRLYAQEFPLRESGDPLDDARAMFLEYYEFSKAHPDYFSLMFVDASTPIAEGVLRAFRRGGSPASDKQIQRCIDAGIFPSSTDATELRMFLWAVVHGPAALRIAQGDTGTEYDDFAANALDVAMAAARDGRIPCVLVGDSGRVSSHAPKVAAAKNRRRW